MTRNRLGFAGLLAFALCAAACVNEEPHRDAVDLAGAGSGSVGRVAQALGGVSQLWSGSSGATPLHVGATYTLFRTMNGANCVLTVVATQSGTGLVPVAPAPACADISAAGGDLFMADSLRNQLYAFRAQPVAMGGTGGGIGGSRQYGWNRIADIPPGNVRKILANSQYVFLEYLPTIYRVAIAGGVVTDLHTNRDLLGIAGTTLYVQRLASGTYTLRTMSEGGSQSILATHDLSFAPDFSFDANYFYWVENGPAGSTNRLRRLPLSGGAVSGFKADSAVTYHLPRSSGSTLYWFETQIGNGSMRIRRMSASGNYVSATFPFGGVSDMLATPTGLYFTPSDSALPPTYSLSRGDL